MSCHGCQEELLFFWELSKNNIYLYQNSLKNKFQYFKRLIFFILCQNIPNCLKSMSCEVFLNFVYS